MFFVSHLLILQCDAEHYISALTLFQIYQTAEQTLVDIDQVADGV